MTISRKQRRLHPERFPHWHEKRQKDGDGISLAALFNLAMIIVIFAVWLSLVYGRPERERTSLAFATDIQQMPFTIPTRQPSGAVFVPLTRPSAAPGMSSTPVATQTRSRTDDLRSTLEVVQLTRTVEHYPTATYEAWLTLPTFTPQPTVTPTWDGSYMWVRESGWVYWNGRGWIVYPTPDLRQP